MEGIERELKRARLEFNVEVLGINRASEVNYNYMLSDRVLPWLQDTSEASVWSNWRATYRDVVIVDSRNRLYATFNLTRHDLAISENRDALKQLFIEAATAVDSDNDKLADAWELGHFTNLDSVAGADADGDGFDNLTEFAFGSRPLDPDSRPVFVAGTRTISGQKFAMCTFRRPAGALFEYVIESSSDLQSWKTADAADVRVVTPRVFFDGSGTAEATLSIPTSRHSVLFVRTRAINSRP